VVAKASVGEAAEALKWFDEWSKKDLVVRELGEWAKSIYRSRCRKIVGGLRDALKIFKEKGYRLEDVERAMTILEYLPEEEKLWNEYFNLSRALKFSMRVDGEKFFKEIIPFIATVDEKVALELSTIEENEDKTVEGDNVKVEAKRFEDNVILDIVFKRSEDANRFRKIDVKPST